MKCRLLGAALLASALCSLPARADLNRFAYTYPWSTPSKGEVELEFWHTQPTSSRHWTDQIELEYGVTDRYMIAPYVILNRSGGFRDVPGQGGEEEEEEEEGSGSEIFDPIRNGASYRWGGFKVEQRYRFGDYGFRKLLPTVYLEYAEPRGEKPEIEGKLIFQYDPGAQFTFAFNLIAERSLRGGAETEWGYSLGGVYLADQKRDRYWFGGEAFGNWTEKQHWAGPTFGGYLDDQTRLVATFGKQFQGRGGDEFRLIVTHQIR